jgi:hypothetical protein
VARAAPVARTGGDICSCGAANSICAFRRSASPHFIWRRHSSGFRSCCKTRARMRRENGDARTFRPREAGEGDHWSSRSERTVVEGAHDSQLRCRCRKFLQREEASKQTRGERKCLDGTETLAARCVLRPLHHPFGVVPLPRFAVAEEAPRFAGAEKIGAYSAACISPASSMKPPAWRRHMAA